MEPIVDQRTGVDPTDTGDAGGISSLQAMVDVLEQVLVGAAPTSLRWRVLLSLQRFSERGVRVLRFRAAGAPPIRSIAAMIEMRDLVRQEERWLRSEMAKVDLSPNQTDTLEFYRAHLVQVGITSELAMAYVGSDREDSADAQWWARRAGELVGETIALAPMMLSLPTDNAAE